MQNEIDSSHVCVMQYDSMLSSVSHYILFLKDVAVETFLSELKGGNMAVAVLRTSTGATPARLDRSLKDLGLSSAASYDCYETFQGKIMLGRSK